MAISSINSTCSVIQSRYLEIREHITFCIQALNCAIDLQLHFWRGRLYMEIQEHILPQLKLLIPLKYVTLNPDKYFKTMISQP